MASKPSIPKGTRDFTPLEMVRREYIFDTVRQVFRLYGYMPIETPAMENLSTLLGKYGEEGDKLLFRILNSGDFLSGVSDEELASRDIQKLSSGICEKGLRYDLTVPFARYVVQHQNEIVFPFKRYQIQPVWRADRPQKGRYREFFQCDVDVIGSDSLLNEAELIKIIDEIFTRLKISVVIRVNNRKVLSGIAEIAGASEKITDITVAIDKIEKIGMESVKEELLAKSLTKESLEKLLPVLTLKGDTFTKLDDLSSALSGSSAGIKGIEEIRTLFGLLGAGELRNKIELDLTLARGLNYYTGAIIEVKSADVAIGSVCGGGRYDNLTGIFGLEGVSGVGVSFGADRIYDVLSHLNMFGEDIAGSTSVLVLNFGENEIGYSLRIMTELHRMGINASLYPDPVRIKKQMAYADAGRIPYVIMAGEEESRNNEITVKDMQTGEQKRIAFDDISDYFSGSEFNSITGR